MFKLLTRTAFFTFFSLFIPSLFAITKNDVKVMRVIDGDTFIISDNLNHIRMANIDAPEKKQTYGYQSYLVLKDKLEGRVVTLDILSKDKYGRLISNVYINGESINEYMVSKGAAWVYKYYCKDEKLYALEYKSKINKIGLWASDKPLPPWIYRSQNK